MPETSDARQSRILKELRKLAFDHPGPVTGAQFVSDVRGSGEAYAPVPTQGKPARHNKSALQNKLAYHRFNQPTGTTARAR